MAGWKKMATAVILIALIGVSVVFAIKGSRRGPVKMPDRGLEAAEEKIDSISFERITKTVGEWQKLKAKKGLVWKNPATGDYTVVDVMMCPHCNETIPSPLLMVAPQHARDRETANKIRAEYNSYKCPKCGKPCILFPM